MAEDKMAELFGSDNSGDEEDDDFKPQQQQEGGDEEQLEDDVEEEEGKGGTAQQQQQQGGAAGATSLFGSDDDEDDGEDGAAARQKAKPAAARAGSSEEGEDEERGNRTNRRQPVAVGNPIDLTCTLVPVPAANSLMLLRTSNIMSIQPRVFDPATFELEQEVYEDSTGKQRVRLASSAVVRWRTRRLPDGREVRESNARMVRWEDGSVQLLLGEEVLDVAQQDMRANSMYLFKQAEVMLQGQGALTTKVALRPASLDSGLHKRLREEVDKRHGVKKNKVELTSGLENPELEGKRMEAAVEEKIRGRTQLARRQDKTLRAYGGSARGSRPSRLNNQYLQEEQEWEAGNEDQYDYDDGLTADQRARLSSARNRTLVDDNAEADMGRRLQAAKRGGPATRSDERSGARRSRRAASDDEEEEEEEDEDEEGDDEEEEEEAEYESSGEEDDEEGDEGKPSEPAAKKAKTAAPSQAKGAAEPKAAAKPRRKGVVLSDDSDD